MGSDARIRTVTLVLQGGHIIKLGGAVDLASLIGHLDESAGNGGVIDIQSSTTERLILRRSALLGVIDSYAPYNTANTAAPASVSKPDEPFPVKPFLLVEDFLPPEDHRKVTTRALDREKQFSISKVSTNRDEYRNSVMLDDDDLIGPMFRQRVQNAALDVAQTLGLHLDHSPSFEQIECQITAHRDGGFYHVHNDSGSIDTANRVFSYVYYFQCRPHAFFGGELKLYEPQIENGVSVVGSEYCLIQPKDNSIVFFPSHILHEVLPTYVPSGAFCDSRFTVNGWVRHEPYT